MFVSEAVFKIFEVVCDKPLVSFVTSVSAPIFFITNLKISKIYLKISILSNVSLHYLLKFFQLLEQFQFVNSLSLQLRLFFLLCLSFEITSSILITSAIFYFLFSFYFPWEVLFTSKDTQKTS